MKMKNRLLHLIILVSNLFIAQQYQFGNLKYSLPKSGSVKNVESMQSITFDSNSDNIIMINRIPNTNLPDFSNFEYGKMSMQDMFLTNQKGFIEKILFVKNNDIEKATLLTTPHFLSNKKLQFINYSIKNIIESGNKRQDIIELYFMIPNKNESYLIIVTSFKSDNAFALDLQNFINSLILTK